MIKPTKKMLEILRLMANGWELGGDTTFDGEYWIQEGGLGKGGESIHNLNCSTVNGLYKRGLIDPGEYRFPVRHYSLTPLGRRALED